MPEQSPLWELTDSWERDERTKRRVRRWAGLLEVKLKYEWMLGEGKRITGWPRNAAIIMEEEGPPEDFPFIAAPSLVVSDRVRQHFTDMSPDAVQYLPVGVRVGKRRLEVGKYWVANVLQVIDCQVLSSAVMYESSTGMRMGSVDLDPRAIPKGLHVFLLAGLRGHAYVTDRMRRSIEAAGFSGCRLRETPLKQEPIFSSEVPDEWRRVSVAELEAERAEDVRRRQR